MLAQQQKWLFYLLLFGIMGRLFKGWTFIQGKSTVVYFLWKGKTIATDLLLPFFFCLMLNGSLGRKQHGSWTLRKLSEVLSFHALFFPPTEISVPLCWECSRHWFETCALKLTLGPVCNDTIEQWDKISKTRWNFHLPRQKCCYWWVKKNTNAPTQSHPTSPTYLPVIHLFTIHPSNLWVCLSFYHLPIHSSSLYHLSYLSLRSKRVTLVLIH